MDVHCRWAPTADEASTAPIEKCANCVVRRVAAASARAKRSVSKVAVVALKSPSRGSSAAQTGQVRPASAQLT